MADPTTNQHEQSPSLISSSPLPTAERRAWIRYDNEFPTEWQIYGRHLEGGFPAEIMDISVTGVGLLLDHPCPVGALLLLRVPAEVRASGWVLLRVKHVAETPTSRFQAGCTFAVALSPEQLQVLLRHDSLS
jgi:hypothetical protein